MWDFLKKLKKEKPAEPKVAEGVKSPAHKDTSESALSAAPAAEKPSQAGVPAPKAEKPHAQKTDDELAEELNKMSPGILSQAKTPQMRKVIIDLYRKMLVDGVDVNDEKEVKKWLKKHPEAVHGGDVQHVETVKRSEPKVGRNDPCTCGSGKKYKKCCGVKAG